MVCGIFRKNKARQSEVSSLQQSEQVCVVKICSNSISFITSVIIVLSLLASFTEGNESSVWPAHYTEAHQDLHRTIRDTSHSHLAGFEIVIPSAVDEDYQHLSHNVRHKRSHRIRRDVTDKDASEKDELRYAVSGFGHDFRFHLEPNHRLVAPNFYVKRIKRQAEELLENNDSVGCHYHGRLMSHRGERIAMSTCEGLTGLLRTEEDDFLLEPIPTQVNHSFDVPMHPHILYKRQHLDNGKHRLHYCGKKRRHPVLIPSSSDNQKIKLLSNGEIELEELTPSTKRSRRSVEFPMHAVGLTETDLDRFDISHRNRPRTKNLETLIVADQEMIRSHERDQRDVTTYVLTVMNMVSALFSDHTLDGKVNVMLVGVMLLEDNEGLHLDHKADRSLANFCRWQAGLNHSDGGGPDHSILLTGIDICVTKNSPCETLGLAQIGGMCSRQDSCTINEDMGLGVAFTVAHETGHSFGMKHDGQSNPCSKRDGHIMSPTLNGLNGVFTWSTCSRKALTDFLGDIDSMCLDNHPAPLRNINSPSQLPGEIYGAEKQCQWQFGASATLCGFRYKYKQDGLCKALWCQRERSVVCETKYLPAVEGTSCGNQMWCRKGVCVPAGSSGPESIDGEWSVYGPWSACTRTCGGGVQYRKRTCTNPSPQYGGRHCNGKDKIYQLCNSKKCPSSHFSFRELQCAEYNSKPYRRRYFKWIPFTKYSSFGRGQCELLCKAEGYGFFDMLADRVIDGTPCDLATSDVCIQGKCEHVGCDNVLGSNATYDVCGVCNGDNSTCETITGEYKESVSISGYYPVGKIPKGARTVRVWEEECCTHSYIAIKSTTTPSLYYLNGDWQVDLYGPTTLAGTDWTYVRKAFQTEYLYTDGPVLEDILIEVLIVSRNPGIKFSYTLQKSSINQTKNAARTNFVQPVAHQYKWSVLYTKCSATCAGGIQTPLITCLRDDMVQAKDQECVSTSRPSSSPRKCNSQSCPARWVTSSWSDCSRSCGAGLQSRQVTCKVENMHGDALVPDSECATLRKPTESQSCQKRSCPPQWHAGSWSKCSRECGRGKRSRSIQCRSGLKRLRNAACDKAAKPKPRERCMITYCQRKYQWFITMWDQCSATCGDGMQRRELKCSYKKPTGQYRTVATRRCRHARRPQVSLQKICSIVTCPNEDPTSAAIPKTQPHRRRYHPRRVFYSNIQRTARWVAGTWQKCTVSCGGGVQVRAVKCLSSGKASQACSNHRKPLNKRACNTYQCSLSASQEKPSTCTDNFAWCYLVPQHGQCSHKYFGVRCCKTCLNAK